jgi:hypothetical protein
MKKSTRLCLAVPIVIFLSACAPEFGSQAWCDDLEKKPKADWTDSEAINYGEYCLVQSREGE